MKVKKVSLRTLLNIYSHPSAVLFRYLEMKMLYEGVKEYIFRKPSLDLGCGDGKIAQFLFDDAFTYGVDNGEAKDVDEAIKNRIYGKVFLEGAEKMSLKDASVNFVFSNSVIEHIPDNDSVLSEVSRILKPGGYFLFTSPSPYFSKFLYVPGILDSLGLKFISNLYVKNRNRMLNHYHLYSHVDYEKKLEKYNLKLIKHAYSISQDTLQLWDKMALMTYFLKFFNPNSDIDIFRKYEATIKKVIESESASLSKGADLLILARKD